MTSYSALAGTVVTSAVTVQLANFVYGIFKDRRSGRTQDTQFLVTSSKSAVDTMAETLSAVRARTHDLEGEIEKAREQVRAVTQTAERWILWAEALENKLIEHQIQLPARPELQREDRR